MPDEEELGTEDKEEVESEEEIKKEMEKGELEEDVYTKEGSELLESDDEINELEEGFMEGYNEAAHKGGHTAKCSNCGKIIIDKPVELKIKKEILRFCSTNCAEKFKKAHKVK